MEMGAYYFTSLILPASEFKGSKYRNDSFWNVFLQKLKMYHMEMCYLPSSYHIINNKVSDIKSEEQRIEK